jgi:tetratricopeptide (TPR) repeat protein
MAFQKFLFGSILLLTFWQEVSLHAFERVQDPFRYDILVPLSQKQAFTVREMFDLSLVHEIVNHLLTLAKDRKGDPKVQEVLCEWSYFLWRLAKKKEEKLSSLQLMRRCAEELRKVNPHTPPAVVWGVMAVALESLTLGVLETFHRVVYLRPLFEEALTLAPRYFSAAPYWLNGRLYFKLPGFPLSIGDVRKSEEYLEKALELAPGFAINHLFLAETKYYLGKKEEAFALLDEIPRVKPTTYWEKYAKWPIMNSARAFREVIEKGEYDRYKWDPILIPFPPPPEDW